MITRRALVTGTTLGAIATAAAGLDAAAGPEAPATPDVPAQEVDNAALRRIAEKTTEIDQTLDGLSGAVRSNSLAFGYVPRIREAYTTYWKIHGKFPDFCEVGVNLFYDIYDWHIKNRQPIPVTRRADGSTSITFMYTELLVRVDQAPDYLGIPFDRT